MNYKLGRIKWIEQEYSWPLDGSRNGPNEWAQRRPAHRNDEDGAEAAAPPGPLEHVPRGVPGLRRSPAGSRRRRRGSCAALRGACPRRRQRGGHRRRPRRWRAGRRWARPCQQGAVG
jgi:hypothetical protein